MNRRQDVIDAAAALLREGGPDALTTVAVAARLGVTQSAIYRHVHNVDELATLASRQVVAKLQEVLNDAVVKPDLSWSNDGDAWTFASLIVEIMANDAKTFEIIDRWRYAEGALGSGIRELLRSGNDIAGVILEREWRIEYGYTEPLTRALNATTRVYADLIQDDVIRLARLVREGRHPGGRPAIARILELRILGGYRAYASDLNRRLGLVKVLN